MEFPESEWYSINDASIQLEISQEKVEHYLETGKLLASVRLPLTMLNIMDDIGSGDIGFDDVEDFDDFSNVYTTDKCEGIFIISRYDRIRWELDNLCDFYTNDISLCKHCDWEHIDVFKFTESYVVRKNEIIIEEEAIQRFLNKYCDGVTLHTKTTFLDFTQYKNISAYCNNEVSSLIGLSPLEQPHNPSNIPPYLDEHRSRFFSPELETAVSAWIAIYHNKDGLNKHRSHKSQIVSWIEKNRKTKHNLSNDAVNRIATMVNHDKRNKKV